MRMMLAFILATILASTASAQGRLGGSRFGDMAYSCDVCLKLTGGLMEGDIDLGTDNKLTFNSDGNTWISANGFENRIYFYANSVERVRLLGTGFITSVPIISSRNIYDSGGILTLGITDCVTNHSGGAGDMCSLGQHEFQDEILADSDITQFSANGSTTLITISSESLTFAASPGDASKITSGLVPDGAWLLGITTRVTTTGTNCTSIDIGDGTDGDIYGAGVAVTSGTTSDNSGATATFANPALSASEVTVTANGGNCFDLVIRVEAHYMNFGAPTS